MRFQSPFLGLLSTCVCLATATIASAATIAVPAGGNLQAPLDAAKPGDVITLEPGASYVGRTRRCSPGRSMQSPQVVGHRFSGASGHG